MLKSKSILLLLALSSVFSTSFAAPKTEKCLDQKNAMTLVCETVESKDLTFVSHSGQNVENIVYRQANGVGVADFSYAHVENVTFVNMLPNSVLDFTGATLKNVRIVTSVNVGVNLNYADVFGLVFDRNSGLTVIANSKTDIYDSRFSKNTYSTNKTLKLPFPKTYGVNLAGALLHDVYFVGNIGRSSFLGSELNFVTFNDNDLKNTDFRANKLLYITGVKNNMSLIVKPVKGKSKVVSFTVNNEAKAKSKK